ncbi:MAG TPA: hypothetical protein VG167_07200 [Verrucomicrobiae bacterium]|nr:hypothetical protein [Verrucomicrobiae bacterium]
MNPEQENFHDLRRLLALKRHEQPPPGYFNDFSQQVIARIRAEEHLGPQSLFERMGWEAPWLLRIWSALETKPVVAGVFGMGVCGILLAGMLYSQSVEPTPGTELIGTSISAPALATVQSESAGPVLGQAVGFDLSKTGGVAAAQMRASLFRQFRAQQVGIEPASFTQPVGGN